MTEKIFVTGSTGNIGSKLIQFLSKKDVEVTAYVRDVEKAKNMFSQSKNIRFVQGDYSTIDVFEREISGHTRLFLLIPITVGEKLPDLKGGISRIAYAAGVRQIVDISSISVGFPHRSTHIGYLSRKSEDRILEERGEEQYYVAIRPSHFFSNHFMFDIHGIKENQTLNTHHAFDYKEDHISPTDIAELASVVLTEPVEKHANYVYTITGETLSTNDRATIFSDVLGKPIKVNSIPIKTMYDQCKTLGISHVVAMDLVQNIESFGPTPYFSITIGRPPQTFREWLMEDNNLARFQ